MSQLIIRGLGSEAEAEELFGGGEVGEVLWARSLGKWAFAVHTAPAETGRTEIFARAALTAYLTGRLEYRPGRSEATPCRDLNHAREQIGDLIDILL